MLRMTKAISTDTSSPKVFSGKYSMATRANFMCFSIFKMLQSTLGSKISFMMVSSMFTPFFHFKIFKTIVRPITIFMMYNFFIKFKFSTKMLFHKITMFCNLSAVYINKFISMMISSRPIGFTRLIKWIIVKFNSQIMKITIPLRKMRSVTIRNFTGFHNRYYTLFVRECQVKLV